MSVEKSEVLSTQKQQEKINNLLAQGTRHNLIDLLAYMQVGQRGLYRAERGNNGKRGEWRHCRHHRYSR